MHGLGSLIQDLDRRVAIYIYDINCGSSECTLAQDSGNSAPPYVTFSNDLLFLQAIKTVEMPKSERAVASLLMAIIKENQNRMRQRVKLGAAVNRKTLLSIVNKISTIVKDLRASGRHEAASLLAQKMLEANFCFVPEVLANEGY